MDERFAGLRERLIELYGLDIEKAEQHFSTRNYAFVFPESPYMVRVSVGAEKSREQALGELLWVDDLKSFSDTVCEPSPSRRGNLFEEFEADGTSYRTSMFRTAKGNVRAADDIGPIDLIVVGDLLGRIHAAGKDAIAEGLRFPLARFDERAEELVERTRDKVAPEVYERLEEVSARIRQVPKDVEHYGIIHGDFHDRNYFMDGHNVWIFDFDDCAYGYFMSDIVSALVSWMRGGYLWPKPRAEVLVEDLVPFFRIGYELHLPFPEDFDELLVPFVRLDQLRSLCIIMNVDRLGMGSGNLERARQSMLQQFMDDDWSAGYDRVCDQRARGVYLKGPSAAADAEPAKVEGGAYEDEFLRIAGAGHVTAWLKDRLDTNNAEAVGGKLESTVDEGADALVLDFSELTYLSSAGIRVVMRLLRKLGSLELRNLPEGVREVLDVTGVLDLPGLTVA